MLILISKFLHKMILINIIVWNLCQPTNMKEIVFIMARGSIFNMFYTITITPDAVPGYGFESFLHIME